jgi:hypothetical protein
MTHKFLISTAAAALLAGTVLAAAQGTPAQAPSGGAMERSAPAQGQSQGGQDQMQGQPDQRRGQAQDQKRDQGQPKTTGQAQPKSEGQQQGQSPAAQGQGEPKGQTQRQPEGRQGQNPDQGQGQRQQGAQKGGSNGASVSFTTEQRTKIRETVIRGGNAPRVTNVNFSLNVGTAVPSHVKVVTVPDVIVEVHPQWRGFMYFVVNEQIIIVDRNHKIVAVIEV